MQRGKKSFTRRKSQGGIRVLHKHSIPEDNCKLYNIHKIWKQRRVTQDDNLQQSCLLHTYWQAAHVLKHLQIRDNHIIYIYIELLLE